MSRELEVEGKNLLTFEELCRVQAYFHVADTAFTTQRNHYFDTAQFQLKEKGCALRLREKNEKLTLTLKVPHEEGLMEYHQALESNEAKAVLEAETFPTGEIEQVFQTELNLELAACRYLGTLTTSRAEVEAENGTFALDDNTYLDTSDCELEFEGTTRAHVNEVLSSLLHELNIPVRDTPNKIQRFFQRKELLKQEG
ncbi:uncharacterized protein YjbK [Salsuginibacillus halophilus]|uniref:Uncharacterized protein YjbK n=1 Tax=Salsuginibacillus halophilus TaxID=517424 RepID=A0A2P8HXH3_9BACI|nr:CYTH domain-containing protein [Salsuginibacillus halophilus]PSL50907.1 uncharacterized protein YjbK [Salsuginibacillus halophilus]